MKGNPGSGGGLLDYVKVGLEGVGVLENPETQRTEEKVDETREDGREIIEATREQSLNILEEALLKPAQERIEILTSRRNQLEQEISLLPGGPAKIRKKRELRRIDGVIRQTEQLIGEKEFDYQEIVDQKIAEQEERLEDEFRGEGGYEGQLLELFQSGKVVEEEDGPEEYTMKKLRFERTDWKNWVKKRTEFDDYDIWKRISSFYTIWGEIESRVMGAYKQVQAQAIGLAEQLKLDSNGEKIPQYMRQGIELQVNRHLSDKIYEEYNRLWREFAHMWRDMGVYWHRRVIQLKGEWPAGESNPGMKFDSTEEAAGFVEVHPPGGSEAEATEFTQQQKNKSEKEPLLTPSPFNSSEVQALQQKIDAQEMEGEAKVAREEGTQQSAVSEQAKDTTMKEAFAESGFEIPQAIAQQETPSYLTEMTEVKDASLPQAESLEAELLPTLRSSRDHEQQPSFDQVAGSQSEKGVDASVVEQGLVEKTVVQESEQPVQDQAKESVEVLSDALLEGQPLRTKHLTDELGLQLKELAEMENGMEGKLVDFSALEQQAEKLVSDQVQIITDHLVRVFRAEKISYDQLMSGEHEDLLAQQADMAFAEWTLGLQEGNDRVQSFFTLREALRDLGQAADYFAQSEKWTNLYLETTANSEFQKVESLGKIQALIEASKNRVTKSFVLPLLSYVSVEQQQVGVSGEAGQGTNLEAAIVSAVGAKYETEAGEVGELTAKDVFETMQEVNEEIEAIEKLGEQVTVGMIGLPEKSAAVSVREQMQSVTDLVRGEHSFVSTSTTGDNLLRALSETEEQEDPASSVNEMEEQEHKLAEQLAQLETEAAQEEEQLLEQETGDEDVNEEEEAQILEENALEEKEHIEQKEHSKAEELFQKVLTEAPIDKEPDGFMAHSADASSVATHSLGTNPSAFNQSEQQLAEQVADNVKDEPVDAFEPTEASEPETSVEFVEPDEVEDSEDSEGLLENEVEQGLVGGRIENDEHPSSMVFAEDSNEEGIQPVPASEEKKEMEDVMTTSQLIDGVGDSSTPASSAIQPEVMASEEHPRSSENETNESEEEDIPTVESLQLEDDSQELMNSEMEEPEDISDHSEDVTETKEFEPPSLDVDPLGDMLAAARIIPEQRVDESEIEQQEEENVSHLATTITPPPATSGSSSLPDDAREDSADQQNHRSVADKQEQVTSVDLSVEESAEYDTGMVEQPRFLVREDDQTQERFIDQKGKVSDPELHSQMEEAFQTVNQIDQGETSDIGREDEKEALPEGSSSPSVEEILGTASVLDQLDSQQQNLDSLEQALVEETDVSAKGLSVQEAGGELENESTDLASLDLLEEKVEALEDYLPELERWNQLAEDELQQSGFETQGLQEILDLEHENEQEVSDTLREKILLAELSQLIGLSHIQAPAERLGQPRDSRELMLRRVKFERGQRLVKRSADLSVEQQTQLNLFGALLQMEHLSPPVVYQQNQELITAFRPAMLDLPINEKIQGEKISLFEKCSPFCGPECWNFPCPQALQHLSKTFLQEQAIGWLGIEQASEITREQFLQPYESLLSNIERLLKDSAQKEKLKQVLEKLLRALGYDSIEEKIQQLLQHLANLRGFVEMKYDELQRLIRMMR